MNTANTSSQFTGANKVIQQQIQPGEELLVPPINSMTNKINDGTNRLTNLLNKFKTIPDKINQLRNKGSAEVAALQEKLNKAKTEVQTESSGYVEGLVKSINNINTSLDGLNTNINSLGSKATEITNVLGQANNSTAGGRNSPTSVASAPGVGQQSNIPLLSSSPSTTVPGYNKTVKQLHDQLGDMISKMKNQARPPSTYAKYTLAKANLAKATSIKQIQQALISVNKVNSNGQNVIFGGKRSRKIRRKYSKKHSKKLRRSSK